MEENIQVTEAPEVTTPEAFTPSEEELTVVKELSRTRFDVHIHHNSHLWKEGMTFTMDGLVFEVTQKRQAKARIKAIGAAH